MAIHQDIILNLNRVHDEMKEACKLAARAENEVKLLLATKTVDPELIRVAIEAGENLIGENRVQEYDQKYEALKDLSCERHFIGHLQTNKVKDILKYVSCIQSVDRMELVEKLDQRLQFEGKSISIFIQVNTSFEDSKFGIDPALAIDFAKKVAKYDTVLIHGFMTIGLQSDNEQMVRKSYQYLREIRDLAIEEAIIPADRGELSMGMSHDLQWAIQEGATMIRVGSAIFGKRG